MNESMEKEKREGGRQKEKMAPRLTLLLKKGKMIVHQSKREMKRTRGARREVDAGTE